MTVLVKTVLIFLEKTPLNKLISAVCELKQTVAFIYCLCVLISQYTTFTFNKIFLSVHQNSLELVLYTL